MNKLTSLFLSLAIMAAGAVVSPRAAFAESILAMGLQAMLDDVRNEDQRREVVALGEEMLEDLEREVVELQGVRDSASGYLVRNADGDYVDVSHGQLAELAETLARDIVLADNPFRLGTQLWLRANGGGQLDVAVGTALFEAFRFRNQSDKNAASFPSRIEDALHLLLDEYDRQNRAELDQLIANIHEDRAGLAGVVERARASWGPIVPPAPPPPQGMMNASGYYVLQYSGRGWHKGGANYATRVVGYENIIVRITDEVTEPRLTRFYWDLPLGFDILEFERLRQQEAEESSRVYCANPPTLGPRDPEPYIWDDGPHYEIVEGPIVEWADAQAVRGNSRRANGDPLGSSFWEHQGDFTYRDLDPVCERYGVSLVD